jgi:hypothetical protein
VDTGKKKKKRTSKINVDGRCTNNHEKKTKDPQVPAICPYPEPTPSSPNDPLQLPEDPS